MKNKYAQIVLGLPVEGPFDYIIPKDAEAKLKVGMRVLVPFGDKKKIGYCVGLSRKTESRYVKEVFTVLDTEPLFEEKILKFFKLLSRVYFCSWGEMIEAALPLSAREGRRINKSSFSGVSSLADAKLTNEPSSDITVSLRNKEAKKFLLLDDYFKPRRIDIFTELIQEVLANGRDVLVIIPEITKLENMAAIFRSKFKDRVVIYHSGLTEKNKLNNWLLMRERFPKIILGSRMAIYSPIDTLGLIIVDDEGSYLHKQEEVPFYNTKDVAVMRAEFFRLPLVFCGPPFSVESYYKSQKNKFVLVDLRENLEDYPKINSIDLKEFGRGNAYMTHVSRPLEFKIREVLSAGKKIVLFLNRSGFSTFIKCLKCGRIIRCKRCEQNLVYHFEVKSLVCHKCGHKEKVYEICPSCNSSYLRYMGMGVEKLESELSRLFPQTKISRFDFEVNKNSAARNRLAEDFKSGRIDILVGTGVLAGEIDLSGVGLLGIINLEQGINFPDFRGSERVFWMLMSLAKLVYSDKGWGEIVIQTFNTKSIILEALKKFDYNLFYQNEIAARRELKLPPFRDMVILNLRGKDGKSVENNAARLFDVLKEKNTNKNVLIFDPLPNPLPKLRDKFRWQVLIKSKNIKQAYKILNEVKALRRRFRGSILTIDVELCS